MSSAGSRGLGPTSAGRWYPADPQHLKALIHELVDDAANPGQSPGTVQPLPQTIIAPQAIIAPHAGYAYSGAIAAAAFSGVARLRFERVVLLGPSHYVGFAGATLPESGVYHTPLGEIELGHQDLVGAEGFEQTDHPFEPEHSLETELPFLQRLLAPGWTLVPILIGPRSTRRDLAHVTRALADAVIDEQTLIVVSSDFVHYGATFGYVPFTDDIPDGIRRLDMGAVDCITTQRFSGSNDEPTPTEGSRTARPDAFRDYIDRTGATICGRLAIEVLLQLLPDATPGQLVAYDSSGRMTGNWEPSVSYAGVTFAGPHHVETTDARR